MDILTYRVGNGLYVNMTNRCSMNCTFCLRSRQKGVGDAPTLWLGKEYSKEEILCDIAKHNPETYGEIVFCGYGEPTIRLYDMLWICNELKNKKSTPRIRLDTNGHASLIAGFDTAPLFGGLFDAVSVSLNAPTAEEYVKLCRPEAGAEAFYAMIDFTEKIKKAVPDTVLSAVDIIGPKKLFECKKLCDRIGVPLRVRHYT